MREAAAWALGEIGDRSAVDALTAALDDADEYVSDGAGWALEKIAAKTEATSKAAD